MCGYTIDRICKTLNSVFELKFSLFLSHGQD